MSPLARFRPLLALAAVVLVLSQLVGASGFAQASASQPAGTNVAARLKKPAHKPSAATIKEPGDEEGEIEEDPYARDDAFYSRRTAGDHPITVDQAAACSRSTAA